MSTQNAPKASEGAEEKAPAAPGSGQGQVESPERDNVATGNPTGSRVDNQVKSARLERANAQDIVRVAQALNLPGLKQKGQRWWAHCLNGHADKAPSLCIRPADNQWTCFSCDSNGHVGGHAVYLVQLKRGCSGNEAIAWVEDKFNLPELRTGRKAGPIERWAALRGIYPEHVRAYGVEAVRDKGPWELHFPMRLEHGGEVVGYQWRRADGKPVFGKGDAAVKSATSKGGHKGLLRPLDWPEANKDTLLMFTEGEPDTCTGHALGFPHTIGTVGKTWSPEVWAVLEAEREKWPGDDVAYIAHGEIPEADARERAKRLRAVLVRPPVYVGREPHDRDLNEWVMVDGIAQVRQAILNAVRGHVSYEAIRRDAREQMHRAVKNYLAGRGVKGRALKPGTWPLLDAYFYWALTHAVPVEPTEIKAGHFKGLTAPVGGWITTVQYMADDLGTTYWAMYKAVELLHNAGVIRREKMQGRAVLLRIDVSAFTYAGRGRNA